MQQIVNSVIAPLKKSYLCIHFRFGSVLLSITSRIPYSKQKIKTKRKNSDNDHIYNTPRSYHAHVLRGGVPKGRLITAGKSTLFSVM